jgi:hypothetical protein
MISSTSIKIELLSLLQLDKGWENFFSSFLLSTRSSFLRLTVSNFLKISLLLIQKDSKAIMYCVTFFMTYETYRVHALINLFFIVLLLEFEHFYNYFGEIAWLWKMSLMMLCLNDDAINNFEFKMQ